MYKNFKFWPIESDRHLHAGSAHLLVGWIDDGRQQVVSQRVEPHQPVDAAAAAAAALNHLTSLPRSPFGRHKLGMKTHRTRSVSLPVLTTAKGSGRLQSQKCSSLLVAMSSSWAVGWKASEAMATLLSVNQLSLPPCTQAHANTHTYNEEHFAHSTC